jgi:hypothetical protein
MMPWRYAAEDTLIELMPYPPVTPAEAQPKPPRWVGYTAALWSLGYGVLGIWWSAGGGGFPFGAANDSGARLSLLGSVRQEDAAPIIAALGLMGAVVAVLMARGIGRGRVAAVMLAFAWAAAIGLALLIPDFRVLVVIAYAPIVLVSAPFGWLPGVRLADAVPWPLMNQAVCMAGGAAWAAAAVAYRREVRGACGYCGRRDQRSGVTSPASAARWGRRAVHIAVAVPFLYAITRWAWALGFPLGISEALYREGADTGLWTRGAALATLAALGALLTFGLVRPWGEVVPRSVPLLGGRRVPPLLAVIPAGIVAVIVTTAGIMFVRMTVAGTFRLGEHRLTLGENFGALAPELLWPAWGAALGAAALAYWYRRRGRCRRCGLEG